MSETEQTNTANDSETSFNIQRVYVKDISFETPKTPDIFQKGWNPEINMEMNSTATPLSDNVYEVILKITVTAKLENEIAFLCEIAQAGIFTITGLEGNQLAHCLQAYCPTILFPYARECVSNLVVRGTFPPITLAHVNFDALFMEHMQRQAQQNQPEIENTENGEPHLQ